MYDKFSLLKMKLYLLSSVNAEQQHDQRQLLVEEKKHVSSTGRPTYVSGLTIRSNSYEGNINPS